MHYHYSKSSVILLFGWTSNIYRFLMSNTHRRSCACDQFCIVTPSKWLLYLSIAYPHFLYLILLVIRFDWSVLSTLFIEEIVESSPVVAEAVSYLTKKVDSKTRDVKVLQPTIATQSVSIKCFLQLEYIIDWLQLHDLLIHAHYFQKYLAIC